MMTTNRNRFVDTGLRISSRERLSKGWGRILCFLMIGLLAACGASTPSREAASPLPESTMSTHASLSSQAVEENSGYRIGPYCKRLPPLRESTRWPIWTG
ncbi:hypothetical protein [Nitrosococcus watsonii]|uniref:hypothetical protein n=1 Tax=Nitrosococcus watsonii TaxID=473531 RepID=UPI001E3B0143|nr:hypothetical protein [Nitrosococcus watsonii]